MNTERTEKFVNAIACDLEEGGFRQVSGTTLRRTLATAVSAALPLMADTGIPASQPAELAEQQGVELPPLPRTHYNACGDGSEPLYTAEQMEDYARSAHARGLMEGLNHPRRRQVIEVQGNVIDHAKALDLLRAGYHVDAAQRTAALNAGISALTTHQPVETQLGYTLSDVHEAYSRGKRDASLTATGKQQVAEMGDSASRLIDAIEGECDGLVISHETAAAILDHVRLGDPWRDAVFSEWALTFIDPQSEVPAEILRSVINWNVRTALDPSASSDAAALVASGKQVGEVQGDALPPLSADEVAAMAPAGLTWDETGAWAMGYEACRKAALAARQPGTYHGDVDLKWLAGSIGEVAHRLRTYMPNLAEWADRARDCGIAAKVLEKFAARQPGDK